MKQIETLIEDIQSLLTEGFTGSGEWTSILGAALGVSVADRLGPDSNQTPRLRPSNLGEQCDRKLWYGVHSPLGLETLPAPTVMKFLFGNILEETILALAVQAGHKVECQQREVSYLGLVGHIDAVIDGVLVDVKSASSIAYIKFANHLEASNDSFGYLSQLGFYLEACQEVEECTDKSRAAFVVIDKTLGKMVLDIHERKQRDWASIVAHKKAMLQSNDIPNRGYLPEEDGKSGNLKLGVACSYCNAKHKCYPGLRTFLYSNGPRFLTHVARVPDVPEV